MESGKQNKIKKGALLFLLGLMLMPLLQDKLQFAKIWHLGGWIDWASKPEITADGWFSGDYQKGEEAYLNQQFGFRSGLVRLNNQLDYWLFNKANAKGIIYGDNGILHDRLYTDAFYGLNYMGDKRIDSITDQIKYLQERLEKDGKTFLMVFAAGKATYYEEYIPDRYRLEKKKNNYNGLLEAMKQKDINHIDFNKWFLDNKTRAQYPLFPQLGIHWSIYGSALAFDSIEKYVEAKRHIDMPDFSIKGVEQPDTLRTPDDDIFQALNLLRPIPYYKMAYPLIDIKNDSTKNKPTLIAIGDSYWWNIYHLGINDRVFANGRFWYYNKDIYHGSDKNDVKHRENIDFGQEVKNTDVIIFCYTESTLQDIGSGFLNDLKNYYETPGFINQQDVDNFEKYIRSDKGWLDKLQKKSKETGVPLDTLIKRDARWQAQNLSKQ